MSEWTSSYQPYRQQRHFHAAQALCKWFLAGLGAGKTLAGLHEFTWAAQDNPDCDGMIVSPTYPMLRDVIIPLLEDWLHPSLYEWHRADQFILYRPTRRKWFLRTATHPDRVRGPNIGYAWYDEPAMVLSRRTWDIMASRVRDPRARRRAIIATSTPRGFNWLVQVFMKGMREGGSYHVTRARTKDNPWLPDDFEAGLRALYGDEFAQQELDARILELQGLAWPINGRVHCHMPLERMIGRVQQVFGAVDWGFTNPAALLVGGTDVDGRWYLFDAWYKRGQDREVIAAAAKELQDRWNVRLWYADHDPEGIRHMRNKGCSVLEAEKDVVAGVQHVRSLLPVRHDGQPRLYVGNWLKDWHREQEGYQFPPKDDRKLDAEEEPIGMHGDHLMDCTRYLTYTHAETWASSEYKTVQRSRMDEGHGPTEWARY